MTLEKQRYFLQTESWVSFWQRAMDSQHTSHHIKQNFKQSSLSCFVYQYPWQLNQNFLYIPKGPILVATKTLTSKEILKLFRKLLKDVFDLAKQQQSTFIKFDFDDSFVEKIGAQNFEQIHQMLQDVMKPDGEDPLPPIKIETNSKTLQYLQTITLDSSILKSASKPGFELIDLLSFYEQNDAFWSQTNQKIRRYTRKSLKEKWTVKYCNDGTLFEDFWTVYQQTSKRQNFAIHSKSYFEKMLQEDFVHLVTLYDEEGHVQSGWFGIYIDSTLTYLYGGNTDYSFAHHGQYLIHLAALKLLTDLKGKFYDLGGYDSDKGFGKFKEGYRGEHREFLGPVDLVVLPRKYYFTKKFIHTAKNLNHLTRAFRS